MIRSKWHHRCARAFAIVLLVSLYANAQTQRPSRQAPASATIESKTGEISGRVVNESGQPLVNARVYVRSATNEAQSTTTNREGVFKVSGLERGSYTVLAAMPAYIPKVRGSTQVVGDSVTLVLVKGGVVTGTVTNAKGEPVVGIGVRVEMVRDDGDRQVGPGHYYENITDDRGVYRIYGLPTGTYVAAADGSGDYFPTGINAYANDMPTYAPSSNREAATEIRVRVGEEISNIDIRYRGERGSAISGTVSGLRDNRGFSVALTSIVENGPRWNKYFQAVDGEFAFEGIPDGDYHLAAMAHWNDRERGLSESMVLNVRGADIEGLELTAAPLASVSGVVVLKALKVPLPECNDKRQPEFSYTSITGWHRVIQGAKKMPQFVWRAGGPERPNAQGNFTLQRLAASEYYFGVRFSAQDWFLQSVAFAPRTPNGKPVDAARTWTTLKPGDQLSGLTVTLAQGAALVRGQIALGEGQTLPEKLVSYLVPAERENAEDPLRYFAAPVDRDGRFWLNNVAPGRYWMLAQPATDDTRRDMSKIRLPDAAETRSSLRHTAEQSKTEIELKPCQDLTFRLPYD